MSEKLIVVDKERLSYEGVFEMQGLIDVMKTWASNKGYFFLEKRHGEALKPEGKWVDLDLEPFKKFTDYAKSIIKVRVQLQDVRDVVVERDGKKMKVQEGKIQIGFDGILETDYEHRWETKPLFYVIRTIFEKYVFTPFISGFERGVREDLMLLKNNIKSYLNLSKYA